VKSINYKDTEVGVRQSKSTLRIEKIFKLLRNLHTNVSLVLIQSRQPNTRVIIHYSDSAQRRFIPFLLQVVLKDVVL